MGSAAGMAFQPLRALHALANAREEVTVGIECLDDVSRSSTSGTAFEQIKFTGKDTPPLNDRNVELWKTIENWATIARSRPEELRAGQLKFILATNKPARKDWLVHKISQAHTHETASKCVLEIKQIIDGEHGKQLKPYTKSVSEIPDDLLIHVVLHIDLEVMQATPTNFRATTIAALGIPTNVDPNAVFDELLGWMSSTAFESWLRKQPALFTRQQFTNAYQQIILRLAAPVYERPQTTVYSQVSEPQLAEQQHEQYVRQLEIIALHAEIDAAKYAFLAEANERWRMANEGELLQHDIESRDARLHNQWRHLARTSRITYHDDRACGQATFSACMRVRERYSAYFDPQEPYLTEGAFHRLANLPTSESLSVGWHPQYKNRL